MALDELRGTLTGVIGLPARLFWSGPGPRAVRWDLANPGRRRDLYEIILIEGTLDDIQRLVNGDDLVELWDQMYLPPWVRGARPTVLVSARRHAGYEPDSFEHLQVLGAPGGSAKGEPNLRETRT